MNKYFLGEDFGFEGIKTGVSVPDSLEVEIEILTSSVKESRESVVFRLGSGGSITARPFIREGVVYICACDSNVYAVDLETGRVTGLF